MLNLERVPVLAPKFANKIGKLCGGYAVIYAADGVKVLVKSKLDDAGRECDPEQDVSLVEFERRVALKNTPSDGERLAALRRKFEVRLNLEFPATGPASGTEAEIQLWLNGRPFAERRALLMSQKDFEKSYPNGFRA